MKVVALLASLALLAACSSDLGEQHAAPPRRFRYEARFYPSLLTACRLVIHANGRVGQLKLTRAPHWETEMDSAQARVSERPGAPAAALDSVPLTAVDLARFYASLGGVRLLEVVPDEHRPRGLDGMTVYNAVTQDDQYHAFHFWSPPKNSPEHQVVAAVLGLARRKFTTPRQKDYFNDLALYVR
jgi:hypothetical protein